MAFSAGATEPRGVGTPLIMCINMIGKKVYVPRLSLGRDCSGRDRATKKDAATVTLYENATSSEERFFTVFRVAAIKESHTPHGDRKLVRSEARGAPEARVLTCAPYLRIYARR